MMRSPLADECKGPDHFGGLDGGVFSSVSPPTTSDKPFPLTPHFDCHCPFRLTANMADDHAYELLCLENPLLDIQAQG